MKERFISWQPRTASLVLVDTCNKIIQELSNYRLTLRQLYYQLVSRDIVPNTERSYQNLSRLVTKARMSGMMDWNAIEDRVRQPWKPAEYADLAELARAALYSYRLPRWEDQDNYAELWVEKDALASVLRPLADKYHVTLMVNRGYSSASAMYDSANRFKEHGDKKCYLFYLGDMDPSGEDMVRDIKDRLFTLEGYGVNVEKIALTIEQVREFDLPPNPAKMTDPRAAEFVAKYGASSWEVDALAPATLEALITAAFDNVIDDDKYQAVIEQEEEDKVRLTEAVDQL